MSWPLTTRSTWRSTTNLATASWSFAAPFDAADLSKDDWAQLHSPAHDTRLRECPECYGGRTDCGVCLGDGWVWKDRVPNDTVLYRDHSGVGHTCRRCARFAVEVIAQQLEDAGVDVAHDARLREWGERLSGSKWVEVSTDLLSELGEWSEPVQVRVEDDRDGRLEMVFRKVNAT